MIDFIVWEVGTLWAYLHAPQPVLTFLLILDVLMKSVDRNIDGFLTQ